jgi:hypothetical protein
MTSDPGHTETLYAVEVNDPPIEPGQIWSMRSEDPKYERWGGIVRALRIIGRYPDDDKDGGRRWVEEDAPNVRTSFNRVGYRDITVIPEYNLRRIFKLDEELSP